MAASCDHVTVDAERVHGLQALLEPDAELLAPGDPLPPLWHWVALPRWSDPDVTGRDGHPRRPPALGDAPVRRMFAGGDITFASAPLRVGDHVSVATELADVVEKTGRSGDFILATFSSVVRTEAGDVALTERQDVVYTDARPSGLAAPIGPLPIVGRPLRSRGGEVQLVTDSTVLLRFSALTSNAHRIHYDLAYAREVEQLPGLLVHGPLINLALTAVARPASDGRSVRRIRHRNLSPLFAGQTAVLAVTGASAGDVSAEATSPDGRTTSRVVIEYALEEPS